MPRSFRTAVSLAFAAIMLSGCIMSRHYEQAYDESFTVPKGAFMVNGVENAVELEGNLTHDGFPIAQAHDTYAVRYMGVNAQGDPILQVLSPNMSRTNVVVERAETDRVHLGGFGIRDVTVIVVDASDDLLTYRLHRVNPWNEKPL